MCCCNCAKYCCVFSYEKSVSINIHVTYEDLSLEAPNTWIYRANRRVLLRMHSNCHIGHCYNATIVKCYLQLQSTVVTNNDSALSLWTSYLYKTQNGTEVCQKENPPKIWKMWSFSWYIILSTTAQHTVRKILILIRMTQFLSHQLLPCASIIFGIIMRTTWRLIDLGLLRIA